MATVAELEAQIATLRASLAALEMSPTGAELLLGNVVIDISNTAAETSTTGFADGEIHAYTSGATIVMQVFDADAAAWRSVTLT